MNMLALYIDGYRWRTVDSIELADTICINIEKPNGILLFRYFGVIGIEGYTPVYRYDLEDIQF